MAREYRSIATLEPTSPLWGGRPSERERAKKAGWGERSGRDFISSEFRAMFGPLPPPGSPLRYCARGSPTLYLESGLRG